GVGGELPQHDSRPGERPRQRQIERPGLSFFGEGPHGDDRDEDHQGGGDVVVVALEIGNLRRDEKVDEEDSRNDEVTGGDEVRLRAGDERAELAPEDRGERHRSATSSVRFEPSTACLKASSRASMVGSIPTTSHSSASARTARPSVASSSASTTPTHSPSATCPWTRRIPGMSTGPSPLASRPRSRSRTRTAAPASRAMALGGPS